MFPLMFLIGHLLGDYVFQHNVCAVNKFKCSLKGWYYCFIHSLNYSLVFSFAMMIYNHRINFLSFPLMIFITHFPIDKISAAKYVMKLLGRKMDSDNVDEKIVGWIVYVVIDNTMHFVLMLAGIKIFFPELIS